jgi:hypothetical protein
MTTIQTISKDCSKYGTFIPQSSVNFISKEVNFPIQGYTKSANLVFNKEGVQRDRVAEHIAGMAGKVRAHGFIDTVKVYPPVNGKFEVAEAQHRVDVIRDMLDEAELKNQDIPISVLWWVDPSDKEEVQRTIHCFNTGNKPWTIWDYVKSNSNMNGTRVAYKDFQQILQDMKDHQSYLTNNIVAAIYSGKLMTHSKLRDGSYRITGEMKPYYNLMLQTISSFVSGEGKKNVPSTFLRLWVQCLHQHIKLLKKDETLSSSDRYSAFNTKIQKCVNSAVEILRVKHTLGAKGHVSLPVDGDIQEWFKSQ